MEAVTVTPGGIRLRLRVQPRSSRNRVVGFHGQAIKVQVTAPPVDGAANAAVADLLAEWLNVPRGAVTIVRGQGARDKVADVSSSDPEQLMRTVKAALQPGTPS